MRDIYEKEREVRSVLVVSIGTMTNTNNKRRRERVGERTEASVASRGMIPMRVGLFGSKRKAVCARPLNRSYCIIALRERSFNVVWSDYYHDTTCLKIPPSGIPSSTGGPTSGAKYKDPSRNTA